MRTSLPAIISRKTFIFLKKHIFPFPIFKREKEVIWDNITWITKYCWKGEIKEVEAAADPHKTSNQNQNSVEGLPWWHSGWESACQCRGHGFKPWSGKIPHAAEQLGPWATITEPARLEPVLRNKRGRDNERPMHRDEEWPPLAATGESPRTEKKTQHSHK